MANIVEGVPFGYDPPISVGAGIPIVATNKGELTVADMTERQLLILQCNLMLSILTELRISNEKMFPNVQWDNERQVYGDALLSEIENLSIE